jgi:hypothetical protein
LDTDTTLLVPGDETSFCLFRVTSTAAVERVKELAEVPFEQVLEVVEVKGDGDGR